MRADPRELDAAFDELRDKATWAGQWATGTAAEATDGVVVGDATLLVAYDEGDKPNEAVRVAVAAVNALDAMLPVLRELARDHGPVSRSAVRGELVVADACPDCLGGIHAEDPENERECGCWGLTAPVCLTCSRPVGHRLGPVPWPCPTWLAVADALGQEVEQP